MYLHIHRDYSTRYKISIRTGGCILVMSLCLYREKYISVYSAEWEWGKDA